MTWNHGRELKSFTKNNVTTTYNYDSNGMRVRKNSSDGNTQYYYDSNNNLIALCYTPTTGTKKVLNFFYDSEGSPVSFQVNSLEKYFYVKNLQGDIEKIVDVFGEVLVTYTYDAWGNILDVTDNSTNNLSTLNPLRYRGYAYDAESGFYYLQSRYYDPQTGRFLNADETQYLGVTKTALSCNLFAYCENNPVENIDPIGFFSIPRWTVSFAIDAAIWAIFSAGATTFAVLTQPVKAVARYAGQAFIKARMKKILFGFANTLARVIVKVAKVLLPVVKKMVG